jgi:hypothetical protein
MPSHPENRTANRPHATTCPFHRAEPCRCRDCLTRGAVRPEITTADGDLLLLSDGVSPRRVDADRLARTPGSRRLPIRPTPNAPRTRSAMANLRAGGLSPPQPCFGVTAVLRYTPNRADLFSCPREHQSADPGAKLFPARTGRRRTASPPGAMSVSSSSIDALAESRSCVPPSVMRVSRVRDRCRG